MQIEHLNPVEYEDIKAELNSYVNNAVFNLVVIDLKMKYMAELEGCSVGGLTAQACHAKLLALRDVVCDLQAMHQHRKTVSRRQ